MKYDEYKRLHGRVRIQISSSVALSLGGKYLPARYGTALAMWNIIAFLSIPASIAVAIFFKWWVGLLLLLFVPATIFSANKKSAVGSVLQHAEENEEFFNMLVENDLLSFRYDL